MINKHIKGLAVLLIVLTLGISGCSPQEMTYYSLLKGEMNLKCYETAGSLKVDVNHLPVSFLAEMDDTQQAAMKAMLDNLTLEFIEKADLKNNLCQADIYLKDKSNNSPRGFFSVRIKDKVMYVRAAGILDIIELFSGPENTSQWRDLLGDAEWVSLSEEEFASLANLPPGQNIGSIFDFNQQMKQKVTVQNLLDKLIADAFKDYNSGCIANVHGKYTLTLKAADLDSVCSSLIKYCINNSDLIASCLKNYVKGLSAEQLELFGADENMRQQILSAIDGAAADIGTNRDAYLQYWQEINWDEYESVIYGSQIVSSIEKTSTGYKNSTLIHVAANGLDIVLSTRQNTKAVQAIEVEVPNTGVVSYAELESQLPSTLKVEVDYSYYCLEKGFSSSCGDIDVKTVDGSVYLPMRQLAEILGEEIVWEEQTGEAYILKKGQKISMTRTIEDGRTFVKVRDLDRLGYRIEWDDVSRTISIQENREPIGVKSLE